MFFRQWLVVIEGQPGRLLEILFPSPAPGPGNNAHEKDEDDHGPDRIYNTHIHGEAPDQRTVLMDVPRPCR